MHVGHRHATRELVNRHLGSMPTPEVVTRITEDKHLMTLPGILQRHRVRHTLSHLIPSRIPFSGVHSLAVRFRRSACYSGSPPASPEVAPPTSLSPIACIASNSPPKGSACASHQFPVGADRAVLAHEEDFASSPPRSRAPAPFDPMAEEYGLVRGGRRPLGPSTVAPPQHQRFLSRTFHGCST